VKRPVLGRRSAAVCLTYPTNPELGPARRCLRTEEERAEVRELLARTPAGSPLRDYRSALLDDAPVVSHAAYVAGLEARLRELTGGAL
jgi:hypothetical protein